MNRSVLGTSTFLLLSFAAGAAALSGCSRCTEENRTPSPANAALAVAVSILPQEYFVRRVGGDRVDVLVLVGSGQSPATYEPTPRQMVRLGRADVFFSIGVPFERVLLEKTKALCPNLLVVDSCSGIELRRMEGCCDHPDENDHDHDHEVAGGLDPHVWLDPLKAKSICRAICNEFVRRDAAHAGVYRRNLAAVEADLDRVHARIAEVLAPLRGRTFYVFHPAFGYFADRFGLKQRAIEVEGKEPSARQLIALVEQARQEGVRVIFVQTQFSARAAQKVAQGIGGAVVRLDPLARDYCANLEALAKALETALKK